jgi:hypothetical protein
LHAMCSSRGNANPLKCRVRKAVNSYFLVSG